MRSLVFVVVDHGDTTDGLQEFVESLPSLGNSCVDQAMVVEYALSVDIPACFRHKDGSDDFSSLAVTGDIISHLLGPLS